MKLTALLSPVVSILFSATTAEGQIVIDSFNAGPFSLQTTTFSVSNNQTASAAEIAGGTRRASMQQDVNAFLPHSTLSVAVGDGYLNYDRQQNSFITLSYGSYIPFETLP